MPVYKNKDFLLIIQKISLILSRQLRISMNKNLKVYSVIVLLMICDILFGQDNKWKFLHLDNNDGMSNSSINVVIQDSQGIMWFGTWDGLNSYDGHQFKQYRSNSSNPTTLSHPVIREIQEENESYLWITTDGGINRLEKKTGKVKRFFPGGTSQRHYGEKAFQCAVNRNTILANCSRGKLFLYVAEIDAFKPLRMPRVLGSSITFLAFDKFSRLWVSDGKRLYRCKVVRNALQTDKTIMLPGNTASLFKGRDGLVYIKTGNTFSYINENATLVDTPITASNNVLCLFKTDNAFFVGTEDGCVVWDKGKAVHLLKGCTVSSLCKGTQNILWIGTDGKGVYQYFEDPHFIKSPKLSNTQSPIRAILKDDKGIWVGSKGGGLSYYKMRKDGSLEQSAYYDLGPGRSSNAVFSLCKGRDGKIYVGTDGHGLSFVEKGKLQKMRYARPEYEGMIFSVYAICQESDSVLFLGTSGNGLLRLSVHGNTVGRIDKFPFNGGSGRLESNIIYSLASDGRWLWVGTRGGGLSRVDKTNGEVTTFRNAPQRENSLVCDDVISLRKDRSGRLWIGTTQGLDLMTRKKESIVFCKIDLGSSSANANIHSIEEDTFGNIWAGTSNGLVRLTPRTGTAVTFYYRDGLQGNEFCDGASFCDTKGSTILFGGTNGISVVSPRQTADGGFMPRVLLKGILIDNQEAFLQDNAIRVGDKAHTIEMDFSVLDFINNDRCELSYSLEYNGLFWRQGSPWTNVGESKRIILSKLFPGNYTLHVRQSNSTHTWAATTLDIPITVAFPLWARWWMIIAYIVIIVSIFRHVFHIKKVHLNILHEAELEHRELQSREDIHQAKLRFFANVARKFTNNMTQIGADIAHLKAGENEESNLKYVNRIEANVQQMNSQISQLADIQKVETRTTELLTEETNLMDAIKCAFDDFSEAIRKKGIRAVIARREDIAYVTTDKDLLSKALDNLFKYIVENAFNDSSIEVLHQWTNDFWTITFTYKGLSPTEKDIRNVFNRYEALENLESRLSDGKSDNVINLTMCNDLLVRMKGEFRIERPSETSTNCILKIPMLELTARKKEMGKESDPVAQIINRKEQTILIVENNEMMAQLMTETLQSHYNIIWAENENDTASAIEANTVDLIIYDPSSSDYSFVNRIKADRLSQNIPLVVVSTAGEKEKYVDIIQRGANAIIEKPFRTDYLKAIADRTMSEMKRMMAFSETSSAYMQKYNSKEFSNSDRKFLERAVELLEANYKDEDYSPDRMAEDLAVSRTQLYRKLKTLIDTTPNNFIVSYRMQHAEKLLKQSKLSVSEVITKCGFRNRAFFYREFTRRHNCSPKDFRKK